jgi:hypothetical protein
MVEVFIFQLNSLKFKGSADSINIKTYGDNLWEEHHAWLRILEVGAN